MASRLDTKDGPGELQEGMRRDCTELRPQTQDLCWCVSPREVADYKLSGWVTLFIAALLFVLYLYSHRPRLILSLLAIGSD